jgi:hypothetical protein
MKHYKDESNNVYAYDSTEQMQKFAKVELIEITDAEKNALLNPPETLEQGRQRLKAEREQALLDVKHTIADNSIYQVRPSDLPNFSMAAQEGQPENWVLDNNMTRLTTVAEMQECILSGIAQGKVIWRSHTDALKALNEQV